MSDDDIKQITREQAEACLAAVKKQFASTIGAGYPEPKLCEPGDLAESWTIVWEEGPFEWTYRAFQGGFDEEIYTLARDAGATEEQATKTATDDGVPTPAGVWTEAKNHWCLCLHPRDAS